jgi:hypothetical protein
MATPSQIMKPPIDSTTPAAPENPQTAVGGRPSTPCSPLDISDIIANAVKERSQDLAIRKRAEEIEAQIEALKLELRDLPKGSNFCIPEWRIELDRRIEAAILNAENA